MAHDDGIPRWVRAAGLVGAGVVGVGATAVGVFAAQTEHAKRTIGPRRGSAPYADGRYGRAKGPSRRLVVIGDSVAAGFGAETRRDTVGAQLAELVAGYGHQAVVLHSVAEVGARSSNLEEQVTRALQYRPHVAVIIIGGNDVTHLVRIGHSTRALTDAVQRLRAVGCQVVVGTCPDLGTVRPIDPPLRWWVRRHSRALATAQAMAVARAGGRAVSMGDLLGPEFESRPGDLFGVDRFHPSNEGYRAVAQVLASSVLAALSRGEEGEVLPTKHQFAVVAPLRQIAAEAAAVPGTEVTSAAGGSPAMHRHSRWGRGVRRNLPEPTPAGDPTAASTSPAAPAAPRDEAAEGTV